jgi:hypothetical protein
MACAAFALAAQWSCKGDDPLAAPVAGLKFITAPADTIVAGEPFTVTVQLLDSAGVSTSARAQVAIALSAGAVISGPTAVVAIKGIAKFENLRLANEATTVALTATSEGTTIASTPFRVVCPRGALVLPASVTGALSVESCVSSGRATAAYQFTMPAAGGVAFSVTSSFVPRLEVRTQPVTDNIVPPTPTAGAPIEWLLPAGTYQVRVSAPTPAGTFSITGASSAANTGCPPHRYVIVAGTYTGQRLAAGDCTFEDASLYDRFVIYTKSGCGVTVTSTAFEPWLFIYDQTANQFIDGRGGLGDSTLHVGMPSCRNLDHPIAFLINADPGFAGTYTLAIQVIAPATLRALPAASATANDESVPAAVVRRIMEMKAARREPR